MNKIIRVTREQLMVGNYSVDGINFNAPIIHYEELDTGDEVYIQKYEPVGFLYLYENGFLSEE